MRSPRPLDFRKQYVRTNTLQLTPDKSLTNDFKIQLKQKLKASMSLGQTHCVACVLRSDQGFYDEQDEGQLSALKIPVYHDLTMQPLRDVKQNVVHVWTRRACTALFAQLEEWGVEYRLTSTMLRLQQVFEGHYLALSPWIRVQACFIPFPVRSGELSTLWNTQLTQRCTDLSLEITWSKRIQAALSIGCTHTVLVQLTQHSYEACKSTQKYAKLLLCLQPRQLWTMQILDRSFVLDVRFKEMVRWVTQHGWEWTLCFAQNTTLSDWCYFVVLLHPPTLL